MIFNAFSWHRGIAMSPVKLLFVGVVAALLLVLPAITQEPSVKKPSVPYGAEDRDAGVDEDERLLDAAGLPSEGPGLLVLFRARARTETKPAQIDELLRRFTSSVLEERVQAATELVALGPLAVPGLRRAANDLEGTEVRQRAQRLLAWADGPKSAALAAAAARLVARQKPAGAAEALLAYLPFADNDDVTQEVVTSLHAVAMIGGQPDAVLVRALADPMPLRRATAGAVLGQVAPSERLAVEKLLADANPEVRLAAALGLAKASYAPAVPVLIDLLAVLSAAKRQQVEEFLTGLAGEWAPVGGPTAEDEIALRIRKGIWAAWWTNTDGPALQELLRKRTLTPEQQEKVTQAIARLGDPIYQIREKASIELVARGRMILPMLREALKHNDPEIVGRAQHCIRRIEEEPANRLPLASLRLMALRKPAGAAETLLAYVPFCEEDATGELQSALAVLAMQEGKPEPALMQALAHAKPMVRAAAAEALAKGGGPDALPAVRKLLDDADINVRLRSAQALAFRDAHAISVLIGLMPGLSSDQAWQVHDFLGRLAGDAAPPGPDDTAESRKKASAAWAEWWKVNSAKADLAKLADAQQHVLGYTVICDHANGTILELGRDHKPRWSFGGTINPVDCWVLPNNRVLVAEYSGNKVTERDLKGNIIWTKQTNGSPHNVQRLPNGHIFIASNVQIFEVDRNGKDVFNLNVGQQIAGAYKDRKGHYICMYQSGVCARLDSTGKQLATFVTNRGNAWGDLRPDGRVIMAQNGGNKVAEYDAGGKLLVDLNAANVCTATGLPNGNFLVACNATGSVIEMDRKGQVVWEYKTQSPFRARGR